MFSITIFNGKDKWPRQKIMTNQISKSIADALRKDIADQLVYADCIDEEFTSIKIDIIRKSWIETIYETAFSKHEDAYKSHAFFSKVLYELAHDGVDERSPAVINMKMAGILLKNFHDTVVEADTLISKDMARSFGGFAGVGMGLAAGAALVLEVLTVTLVIKAFIVIGIAAASAGIGILIGGLVASALYSGTKV